MCFFGVPAIGGPTQHFLAIFVVNVIADAEIAISLPVMLARRVLTKSDAESAE